jgi:hypothetical protein
VKERDKLANLGIDWTNWTRMDTKIGLNTFTAIADLSRFNNSCLKSPASTLVDLIFQSRSFSFNQLRDLSLLAGNCTAASVYLTDFIPFIVDAYIAI